MKDRERLAGQRMIAPNEKYEYNKKCIGMEEGCCIRGGMGMSIKNEPNIRNKLIAAIREQLEHRALWMYLLCDEAQKKGLAPEEYAPAAIKRCGLYQGANLRAKAGGGDSLKGLKKTLFPKAAQWVFEMDIKRCDDDHLDIDFHYCPLVKAWQKQGCSEEEIRRLCDHAMCGDRGIAESFGCELELPATIARGDDVCQIRFVRRNREGSYSTGGRTVC